MKIGINTFLFSSPFTAENFGLFKRFREWGFAGVEPALENRGDFDYGAAARQLAAAGLACSSVCGAYGSGRDLRGSSAEQQTAKRYAHDCIDACSALGCRLFVGPHYSVVGRTSLRSDAERAADWTLAVTNLREVCAYAEQRGVTLGLEPLNRFESDFINTVDQARRLIDDVGSPALKIHLDTFHMNIEEKNLPDAIRRAGPLLCHVHASENDRGAPGTGHTDWKGIVAALEEIGYDGWIVIESFTPDVQVMARAASIWRQIEPSAEALARNGRAFLAGLVR